jgi:ubiquinone/menaquinone biosynthesis C-methylase UbiE
VDAASHRTEKAQSGKPVSSVIDAGPDARVAGGQDDLASGVFLTVGAREGYDRWAPTYDRIPNPLLAREERYLLPLLTDLSNRSVLDLGCGTGRWLAQLMVRGARRAVGIDRSAAMLRIARQKAAIRQRLVESSCENLPFESATFDLAICSFALGHIDDLEAMARHLARVTRANADVFISDLHPEAYARGWRVGFRDGATAVQIEMRSRSVAEIVQTFRTNGFECRASDALWLGEPEKEFFVRAGKGHLFAEACQLPAVLVCHLRRLEASAENGEAK